MMYVNEDGWKDVENKWLFIKMLKVMEYKFLLLSPGNVHKDVYFSGITVSIT